MITEKNQQTMTSLSEENYINFVKNYATLLRKIRAIIVDLDYYSKLDEPTTWFEVADQHCAPMTLLRVAREALTEFEEAYALSHVHYPDQLGNVVADCELYTDLFNKTLLFEVSLQARFNTK